MKKKLIIMAIISFIHCFVTAQKASDVIENGIKVKSGDEIFLKYDGTDILHQKGTTPGLTFKRIKDSAMLLPVEASVVFYLRPLNPLNHSYKSENKIIIDPIDEAAAAALGSVIDLIQNVDEQNQRLKTKTDSTKVNGRTIRKDTIVKDEICKFNSWIINFKAIVERLKNSQKDKIVATFKQLEGLNFEGEQATINSIEKAKISLDQIAGFFEKTGKDIDEFKKSIELVSCDADKNYEFIVEQVFQMAIRDLEATYAEQKKRLNNLEKTYALVKTAQEDASAVSWLIRVREVPATGGKISIFTISVNESGFNLSTDNEIIPAETKEKVSKSLRIRKFQRFVPEVSVGVAHTNLSFPKYSTNADAAGKHLVAEAGEEKINKVNFTTMINYNLFIDNSPIHPFWQIGIGVNTDFPTLLTGVGARLNFNGGRRLALAFGIATTWIKTLDELKIGDIVSGPADVEKDIKFKFNQKPQTYFGIQYNF